MERYFGIAELYSKPTSGDVAYSALPDAPVLPCVEANHRIRAALARLRIPAERLVVAERPARLSAEC